MKVSSRALITGRALQESVEALGLTRYTVQEMDDFVNQLASYISLKLEDDEHHLNLASPGRPLKAQKGDGPSGKPDWHWPLCQVEPQSPVGSVVSMELNPTPRLELVSYNAVPVQALMEVFLADERDILRARIFDSPSFRQFQAMREILLAGDTNRLVAELTFVRINDLAAPPEDRSQPLAFMEHLVTFIIIANAVSLSLMADPLYADWSGWQGVEAFFASFLLVEIALRMIMEGFSRYWVGDEMLWNLFDVALALVAWTDILVLQMLTEESELFSTGFLRIIRLIRLVRVMRVFRLKVFKELRLMVKGLLAGIWTLSLAFVLLFSVLYLVSGFATIAIGNNARTTALGLEKQFASVPDSMFTAFRCFTGDCNSDSGQPIASLLAAEYGIPFILCFVVSYMLVAMGIFNVILAVYVDITMKAAKETETLTAEQHARESIRIARTTRELLKKFASFHKIMKEDGGELDEILKMDSRPSVHFTDEDIYENLAISKECFLMVIQDRTVQHLMDDLDLPPDRANLFEIIDADGSGTLHITELVHGLLKIRGDVKKSDTVASLLATKAVQQMVQEMRQESKAELEALHKDVVAELKAHLRWRGPARSAQV
ncbi:unnamed protein product [Effrenium voratum]|nr:unnamed protein product [Effrenium voratum]